MRTWDVAVQEQVDLGEAPFWNDERQCLWFVDITGGVLHRFDPRTGAIGGQLVGSPSVPRLPQSMAGWSSHGQTGCTDTTGTTAGQSSSPPIEPPDATIQLNDAACDPIGRLWAGTIEGSSLPGGGITTTGGGGGGRRRAAGESRQTE